MKNEPSKIKSDILIRVRALYILFILIGLVVFGRILWVQLFSREIDVNAKRLEKRIFSTDIIPARRGTIYSRHGDPLATSIFRYQVDMDFATESLRSREMTFYEESDSLAKLLSAFFGDRSAAEYRTLFRTEYRRERDNYELRNARDTVLLREDFKERSFLGRLWARLQGEATVTVTCHDTIRRHRAVRLFPREVDYNEWQILSDYPLLNWSLGKTYHLIESDQRIYPQGGLARRTIGDKGRYGRPEKPGGDSLFGNYGLEDHFRREIAGRDGRIRRQRIAHGFAGRVVDSKGESEEDAVKPIDGADVITTLDVDVQDVADRALREQLERQNATWGTTIVMESRTGEILAMANLGRTKSGYAENDNYALSYTMEPGSTFKLATVLTLLEEAEMSPATRYETNNGDYVDVGPARKIRDSHRGDREIDLRRAVAGSSNVYFARAMWDRYGATGRKKAYSDFLHERLHLGERVGLEMLGEVAPRVTRDWKVADPGVMLVKMAYGYRVELAPIHVLTLYNAVANDGRMITPVVVRELRRDSTTLERFESRTIERKIASEETLQLVGELLQAVCTEGTASQFFGDTTLLRVAAKTGTAQVTAPRPEPGSHYLGSMVAFFPAENPRYTVLTSIETRLQSGKAYYGGPLAGPVVKQVVDYLYNRDRANSRPLAESGRERHPERMKGGDIGQVCTVAGELSPRVKSSHSSGWGHATVDSLARVTVAELDCADGVMPRVAGMGLKDALFLLESRGLKVQATGQGAVVAQSIRPGTPIRPGERVEIRLN